MTHMPNIHCAALWPWLSLLSLRAVVGLPYSAQTNVVPSDLDVVARWYWHGSCDGRL